MTAARTVHFVYRKPKWGSTIMRIFQLAESIRRYAGDRVDVVMTRLPDYGLPGEQYLWAKRQPKDGIFFFSKSCLSKVSDSTLESLRQKGGVICFDLVDQDLKDTPKSGADLHVCTSFAQEAAVKRLTSTGEMGPGETFLLLHNNDIKLENIRANPLADLKAVYVGLGQNLVLPPAIAKDVRIFDLGEGITFDDVVLKLSDYNFHFAVRPARAEGSEIYKPFLKGFVAAACRSNIMVLRDTDDAEAFLGTEYPYLVTTADSAACAEAMARARDDFAGPEWQRALDVMASIKDRVSPKTIALRFADMIDHLKA